MLIQKQSETDSLYRIIDLQEIRLKNMNSVQIMQSENIDLMNELIENEKDKNKLSKSYQSGLKKKIRNRNLIIITSTLINTFLIIKSLN
jgi:Flp pilus assembly protein TadB